MQPGAMLPEIVLLVGALVTLVTGSFQPRQRQWVSRLVCLSALVLAAVAAVVDLNGASRLVFESAYAVDTATGVARLVVVLATALVVALAVDELSGDPRESETYVLLLLSALGAVVLAGASDLILLVAAYLLASIPLYALVGLGRTRSAAEAAMKTYLLGALFGIAMMLGVVVLYGVAGTTTYTELPAALASAPSAALAGGVVLVLGGLMFEAGGVPGHFWVPDAVEGTSSTAAAYLTTVPKVGALVATFRLVAALPDTLQWTLLVGLLATASMTLGNLAAYAQTDPRRLLGWSTVSQVGYLLVPVAVAGSSDLALPSLLVYLAAYAVTNVAAFAVVAALPQRRTLASYRGLAASRPWLAVGLLVCLLGLVGTPPTAVFVGKVTTATAAWDGGAAWLALVVMVNSLASLFYYLRWLIPVFATGEPVSRTARGAFVPRAWAWRTALGAAGASLAIGVASGALWALVSGSLAS